MYQVLDEAILNCTHEKKQPVRRIDGSGHLKVYLQCPVCGDGFGARKLRDYDVDSLPWWDESLIERRNNLREQARLRKQAEIENKCGEWWDRYNAYLLTPHWAELRRLVIQRDNCRCQNCFCPVSEETAHVHHISYVGFSRLGYSFAFECVTLCRRCHQFAHALRQP